LLGRAAVHGGKSHRVNKIIGDIGMNAEVMNKDLEEIYQQKYNHELKDLIELNKTINDKDEKATNPLLLKVNDEYAKADYKVMIFGQETNNWLGDIDEGIFCNRMKDVIDLYDEFYLTENCFSYGGQFWNGFSRFRELLNEKKKKEKVGYMWNNVVKIGSRTKGFPSQIYEPFIKNSFNKIIIDELNILKPDLILFLSGPYYDEVLTDIFDEFEKNSIKGFTERQMCKINIKYGNASFRTYHPNYLWRNDINSYYESILKNIY
jgi:hypothetical protein